MVQLLFNHLIGPQPSRSFSLMLCGFRADCDLLDIIHRYVSPLKLSPKDGPVLWTDAVSHLSYPPATRTRAA
jgi:hypothetical protein